MLKISTNKKLPGGTPVAISKLKGEPSKYLYLKKGCLFGEEGDGVNGWKNDIKLEKGKFDPLPRDDIVEKLYISGPSGSGKTVYASKYIEKYLKKNKADEFYLFSLIDNDETLDKLDPFRIDIDESLITDPITVEDLSNSVVVFDDAELVKNKQVKHAMFNLADQIATIGRHYDTRIIMISHVMTNYKETRVILVEATSITFFPHAGATNGIKRVLETYVGLDKKKIEKILKIKSRWVTIYKSAPMYLLHERGAMLVNSI